MLSQETSEILQPWPRQLAVVWPPWRSQQRNTVWPSPSRHFHRHPWGNSNLFLRYPLDTDIELTDEFQLLVTCTDMSWHPWGNYIEAIPIISCPSFDTLEFWPSHHFLGQSEPGFLWTANCSSTVQFWCLHRWQNYWFGPFGRFLCMVYWRVNVDKRQWLSHLWSLFSWWYIAI